MPLQNRVDPLGRLSAVADRGTVMGNRGGRIHDANRKLSGRRWASRAWICCRLAFKGRRREVMAPRSYTELFFLDEATALAAGHRPCAECRRADFLQFAGLWASQSGLADRARADQMDQVLHGERLAVIGVENAPLVRIGELPPGCMVVLDHNPHLVSTAGLRCWSPQGYLPATSPGRSARVRLITPPSISAVLAAGYRPALHATADRD